MNMENNTNTETRQAMIAVLRVNNPFATHTFNFSADMKEER